MSDKRKVSTDALETLGTIFEHGERDAIHLAVEPVIAGEKIRPGENIGIRAGKAYAKSALVDKHLGIADPFLKEQIQPGQKFWLVVYPRQITSLRDVWSHPDFEEATPRVYDSSESIEWLENFARSEGLEYGTLMNHAEDGWMPSSDGISVPDEFWTHYENVTGHSVSNRHSYFSCAC
jgi:hypothetical protein